MRLHSNRPTDIIPDGAWNIINVQGLGGVVLNLLKHRRVRHGQVILVGTPGTGWRYRGAVIQGALQGRHGKQGGRFSIHLYVRWWTKETLRGELALLVVQAVQPPVLLVLRLPDQRGLLQDHDLLHELPELGLADCSLVPSLFSHPENLLDIFPICSCYLT